MEKSSVDNSATNRRRFIILVTLAAVVIIGWTLYALSKNEGPQANQPFFPSDSTETTSSDPNNPTQGVNSNGNGEVPGTNGMPAEAPVTDR